MLRARAFALLILFTALPAAAKPPRLTLVIVVDSLSSDLLLRSRPQFHFGLRTLMDGGAYYPYSRYEYSLPVTAPGHSTLATGANPYRHGIVGNKIYNRQTGKPELPFADATHPALEAPLGNDDVSPENLMVETLADRLRESTQGRGKAIALSFKARAAIPLAGHLGQAFWFSPEVGKFVTGTYYAKEFPGWVRAFNDKKQVDEFFGKSWTLLQPAKSYVGEDDRPYEAATPGSSRTFPHALSSGLTTPCPPYYEQLASTPGFGDVLVSFAKAALEGESLGKDDVPDLLAVSFSHTDRILHRYGPQSWEAQDTMLRLDRQIGELLSAAEHAAGKGNVLVVLSADHGGDSMTEELSASGMPAARANTAQLKVALNKELATRFGGTLEYVVGIEQQQVYLNPRIFQDKAPDRALDPAAIRRAAAAFLHLQPGVAIAATREDVQAGAELGGFGRALRLDFFPDRSGDVFIIPKPHVALSDDVLVATHYSPYAYDQQVPAIFYGHGVRRGTYRSEFHPTDVAPMICAYWEMGPPASAEGVLRPESMLER